MTQARIRLGWPTVVPRPSSSAAREDPILHASFWPRAATLPRRSAIQPSGSSRDRRPGGIRLPWSWPGRGAVSVPRPPVTCGSTGRHGGATVRTSADGGWSTGTTRDPKAVGWRFVAARDRSVGRAGHVAQPSPSAADRETYAPGVEPAPWGVRRPWRSTIRW